VRGFHKHHAGGERAPRDHDARDPQPRADALHDEIARNLEEDVADEEHAGAEPVDHVAETEIGLHLQRRIADVDPVEIVDDVAGEQIRNQAARHFAHHARRLDRIHVFSLRQSLPKIIRKRNVVQGCFPAVNLTTAGPGVISRRGKSWRRK
jgi:hypothetical protein